MCTGIDFTKDEPITLSEATKVIPGRPSFATVWRWSTKGVNGIRLRTLLIGNRRYTTREALQEFFERRTEAADADVG